MKAVKRRSARGSSDVPGDQASDGSCFPGDALVHERQRGQLRMAELRRRHDSVFRQPMGGIDQLALKTELAGMACGCHL